MPDVDPPFELEDTSPVTAGARLTTSNRRAGRKNAADPGLLLFGDTDQGLLEEVDVELPDEGCLPYAEQVEEAKRTELIEARCPIVHDTIF